MAHRYGKFTSRTKARKRAADILFESDQKCLVSNRSALLELLEERKGITSASSPLPEYAVTLVTGVADEYNQIEHLLEGRARGAGLDRLPAVDLAVLRVATWELLRNGEEVPPVSAIDEAVTIVKQLSTDDSPAYVNAVLDAIRKDLDNPWARGTKSVVEGATEPTEPAVDVTVQEVASDSAAPFDEDLDELLGEY